MTDRVEVHVAQISNGLRRALVWSPEPSGGDSRICFRNGPLIAVFISQRIAALHVVIASICFDIDIGLGPGVLGRIAILISDPAHRRVGAALEDHAFAVIAGFQALLCLDGVIPALEVIFLGIGSAALCAVHPDFGEVAVISIFVIAQDLIELVDIVIVVIQDIICRIGRIAIGIIISIAFCIDVPWRQIQAHVHIISRAGLTDLRQDVSLSVLVAGGSDVIFRIIAGPDTEAVMMLCRHDDLLESGIVECLDQRFCVEILFQREDLIRCPVSVILSPFNIVEGVRSEVDKTSKLFLLITILLRCRRHAPGLRHGRAIVRQIAVIGKIFGCRNGSDCRNTCENAHRHDGRKRNLVQFHCVLLPFFLPDSRS